MRASGGSLEVFWAFLRLGLTSFGGPIAHLGYFRRDFVARRAWLSEAEYAALLSLCQVLPGPASSQTGFGIGLLRAGWRGGLAAWVGFTLPSAVLMFGLAEGAARFAQAPRVQHLSHGLQLAAVAVVAQAVLAMARSLCPDAARRGLGLGGLLLLLVLPGAAGQLVVLALGGLIGWLWLRRAPAAPAAVGPAISGKFGIGALVVFGGLLLLCLLAGRHGGLALFAAFYRVGALVFGGGHVVLPLLQSAVVAPGWVPPGLSLAGYGAAQAMPGPVFSVAAFLGAVAQGGPGGVAGAALALAGIFLPGLLLVAGLLPFWHGALRRPGFAGAVAGVNAAVVGLLGFALLTIVRGAVRGPLDFAVVLLALLALLAARLPPVLVVLGCAGFAAFV